MINVIAVFHFDNRWISLVSGLILTNLLYPFINKGYKGLCLFSI